MVRWLVWYDRFIDDGVCRQRTRSESYNYGSYRPCACEQRERGEVEGEYQMVNGEME